MQHDIHVDQSITSSSLVSLSDNRLLFYPTGSRNRTSTRTKFVTEFATKSSEEVDFCRLNRPQTSMSLSVESRPKSASIRIVRSRRRSPVSYLVVSNRVLSCRPMWRVSTAVYISTSTRVWASGSGHPGPRDPGPGCPGPG